MSPSDDELHTTDEEFIPPVDKNAGNKMNAAMKNTMEDSLLMARIEKDSASTKAAVDAELLDVQQTTLTCIECRLDGTVPVQQKTTVYTHAQFDKHLKPSYLVVSR